MKKSIRNSLKKHYSDSLKEFGYKPQALHWTKNRQSTRFQVINQIGQMANTSILDVGCGFGDFYGFLQYKKIKSKYYGVDINEEILEVAKKKYPKANFELRDMQEKKFNRKFDWVIAIGVTNHASTYSHLKNLLNEMFSICRKGVVMDFISNYVDYKQRKIFYTSPEVMFKFAKNLTKRVTLRHDYMPFEFCLYLYKNDKKNKKNVFQEYSKDLPKSIQNDFWLKNSTISKRK